MLPLFLLWQTARLTEAGYQLQQARRERDHWLQQVYLAEARLAELQSLPVIERAAREQLRMVPAERYVIVQVEEPRTQPSQTDLLRLPAPPEETPPPAEGPWRLVRRLVDRLLP